MFLKLYKLQSAMDLLKTACPCTRNHPVNGQPYAGCNGVIAHEARKSSSVDKMFFLSIFFDNERSRRAKPWQCGNRSTPLEHRERHQRQRLTRQHRLFTEKNPKNS